MPHREVWDGFPFFAFAGGGDVMRKTLILFVPSLLLVSSTVAFACFRPIAKPQYGDPDEFQAQRYHDEANRSPDSLPDVGGGRENLGVFDLEKRHRRSERKYLSINYAGITFFLER
jgi:hypothetical protein